MLYIYYGTDTNKIINKVNTLISALVSKDSDAELVYVTDDSVTQFSFDEVLGSQGLFKRNYIVYMNNVDEVFFSFSDIQLMQMKQSGHIFIVRLDKIKKPILENLEKNSDKLIEINKTKNINKNSSYNIFNIANAIKNRNKKQIWENVNIAILYGNSVESIVGVIFWALKDLSKKQNYNKYSQNEIKKLMIIFSEVLSYSRINNLDSFKILEKNILTKI